MNAKVVCSAIVTLLIIGNFGIASVNEQNTDGIATHIETKASGTTYYVAKDGNDSNPGTLAEPWLTIGKANQELQPGDTVYIRERVYQESIAPINSGTSGRYITYQNYPGETVNITNVNRGADLTNKEYIKLDGLNIIDCNSRWVLLDTANHNTIQNCFMEENSGWSGIYLKDAHYNKILNNTIEGADDSLYVQYNSTHNLIEGNDFGDAGHGCIDIVGPAGSVEFGPNPSYNIVRYNWLHSKLHTSFQLEMNAHHNLIEKNWIYESSTQETTPGNGLQVDASANIIRHNLLYANEHEGLAISAYWYGGTFKHCNYNKIYNNVIYGNGRGQETNTVETMHDNIFKNNIYFNNDNTIYFWSSDTEEDYNPYSCNFIIGETPGENVITWKHVPHTLEYMESNHPTLFFGNLETDPQFVNPANGNFTLQGNSPAIDAGDWLTCTSGSGSGTQLTVEDAGYFFDGYDIVEGDLIQLEGHVQTARITNVDYDNNVITIDRELTWQSGQGVSLPYSGSAPDIGAYEYSSGSIWTEITKPEQRYLYIFDKEIIPLPRNTIIIGMITVEAEASSMNGIEKVEFYIDGVLCHSDYDIPYQWLWDEFAFGNHEIKVIAYNSGGNKAEDEINVMIFNIGGMK